jgi:hypothetical protein
MIGSSDCELGQAVAATGRHRRTFGDWLVRSRRRPLLRHGPQRLRHLTSANGCVVNRRASRRSGWRLPRSAWGLRTVTLAPASRSRCATGRPRVPVPPVTRIDVVMTFPFTGRAQRGWNIGYTGTILGNGQPARPRPCRSRASRWQCSASRQAANWLDPAANRKSPGSVIRLPNDTGRPDGSALIRACTRRPPADGCAYRSVCIYNPDLDPGRHGGDAIISYITQAVTVSNQPAHCSRAKDPPFCMVTPLSARSSDGAQSGPICSLSPPCGGHADNPPRDGPD